MKHFTVVAMALALGACTASRQPFPPMSAATQLRGVVQADVLADNLSASTVDAVNRLAKSLSADFVGATVLASTVVDVSQLSHSSPLGKTLGERVVTSLVANGFKVVEVRLRDHLLIDEEQGEIILSRNSQYISTAHQVDLVVTGTYSVASRVTYVSLKAVRASNGKIEAAVDFELKNSPDVLTLLQGRKR